MLKYNRKQPEQLPLPPIVSAEITQPDTLDVYEKTITVAVANQSISIKASNCRNGDHIYIDLMCAREVANAINTIVDQMEDEEKA